MGYNEPWLHESGEDAMRAVIDEMRATYPQFAGITLERLQQEGSVALTFAAEHEVPFADGHFPTPSGKVELLCAALSSQGIDPLPDYVAPTEFRQNKRQRLPNEDGETDADSAPALMLISGASHHYVSSSFANQASLIDKEGQPFIEINPQDAAASGIIHGAQVLVENERGSCELRAIVTEDVPPGVAVAPKGPWARLSRGKRNINWTTPDVLADLAGQSTFHSNLVRVRMLEPRTENREPRTESQEPRSCTRV
jgi:anaerobic selenocysteine-containing dehydrogenase